MPLHLAGAMWRTDAVLAAGGSSATVGGSDIGLMLGVDAAWSSVYVPVLTFTYYHHANQVTASSDWQLQFARDMRFLERRHDALEVIEQVERRRLALPLPVGLRTSDGMIGNPLYTPRRLRPL